MSDDKDPMDYYDEYNEWLMMESGIAIRNGDDLIRHFENGTRFEEFLEWHNSNRRK